jgi:hypothetical protein
VLSVLALIFAAFAATLSSGDYLESWVYLLLDVGEAAFGLVLGYVVAARLLPVRTARDATEAPR